MTFSDIFKSSFLEKATEFSVVDTLIAMGLAFAIGLFIMLVYQKTFRGVIYSRTFTFSLMGMTLITTLIILAVTSNVILSLGMVGALSIVRFRTAIKEPMDIVYLFWAISSGIVIGAGLIPLAVMGALFIGLVMVLFVNADVRDNPYILILACDGDAAETAAMQMVADTGKRCLIQSKTASRGRTELTVEVKLREMTGDFVTRLSEIPGVESAVLVSYNGDYMG